MRTFGGKVRTCVLTAVAVPVIAVAMMPTAQAIPATDAFQTNIYDGNYNPPWVQGASFLEHTDDTCGSFTYTVAVKAHISHITSTRAYITSLAVQIQNYGKKNARARVKPVGANIYSAKSYYRTNDTQFKIVEAGEISKLNVTVKKWVNYVNHRFVVQQRVTTGDTNSGDVQLYCGATLSTQFIWHEG